MKKAFCILFIMAFFGSCKPDPKIPRWDVDVLTPMVHSRLEISDIVPDSNITVSEDGLISLVYRGQLADLKPDEIVEPLNQEFYNSIKLENIDFGERTITDHISLGDLAKGGTAVGQVIIQSHGKMAVIPVFPNQGPKNFVVDATDYFQTVTLADGNLEFNIANGLPVELTNVNFQLENLSSGTVIFNKNISSLPAGGSASETFSLAGTTIEGKLKATLLTIESPGSNGDLVLVDTSDQITVSIGLTKLKPLSATAIFPDQVLANDTDDTSIPAGHAELTSMHVRQGSIFLDATSTVEDVIVLDYLIPNATKGSSSLGFSESIEAAPPNGTSSRYAEYDISGYKVDLTGRPGTSVYNTFYTVLKGSIDSSGNLIHLSLQDSVYLKTGIQNLTAERGDGWLGKDTISSVESSQADVFEILRDGVFDLDDALLDVEIENHIGAPISLRLNQLTASTSSASASLSWSQLGQLQLVPAATLAGNVPAPSHFNLKISGNNNNLDELIELQPDAFLTNIDAFLNGSLPSPDYNQFIFTDYGVKIWLSLTIPLNFSGSGLQLADTSAFDYSDVDPDHQLQQGELRLISDNSFPLEGTVVLHLLNAAGESLGILESTDKILAPAIDANGNSTGLKRSIVVYPLAPGAVKELKKTEHIVFDVRFDTPSPPKKIRILQQNYLDLTLSGDLTIRTK